MSTIEVTYITSSGTTDISNNIMYSTANFESQLGAMPGQFEFTCKDPDRVLSFSAGNRIHVRIDGQLLYGGYVLQVEKKFAFSVDVLPVDSRLWVLRGADYNILFDRRFMFNLASPTQRIPAVAAGATDSSIVGLITSSYIDLTTDDIDTTTHVTTVETLAGKWGFWGVATPWRKEMVSLSAKTGAIWYLAPGNGAKEIDLYWRGREVVTPGWGFSDTPNGVTTFGFRELFFTDDASNLVNDGLVWAGNQYGPTGVTGSLLFGRSRDETSIADLFLSQRAEPYFGDSAYTSTLAAQQRANIIVYGRSDGESSPGATGEGSADPARGLRNPQKQLRLSWFGETVPSVLIPGSVVSVYLSSFSETFTLPVRSLRISFPNLYPNGDPIVRYDGFLGVQTDDPFTLWAYMKSVADTGGTGGTTAATGAGTTPGGGVNITPVSDGSAPAAVAGTDVCMTPSRAPGFGNQTFYLTDAYQPGSSKVWVNGLRWRRGIEYTESDPLNKEITFFDAPLSGDQLWVCYTSSGF